MSDLTSTVDLISSLPAWQLQALEILFDLIRLGVVDAQDENAVLKAITELYDVFRPQPTN
jgi:hypothetical protein